VRERAEQIFASRQRTSVTLGKEKGKQNLMPFPGVAGRGGSVQGTRANEMGYSKMAGRDDGQVGSPPGPRLLGETERRREACD